MHIVIGDGGNREGLADTYDEPQPEWSAYREASFGSGTLDLLNATHALWRWHRNQDSQAVVSDEVSPLPLMLGMRSGAPVCAADARTSRLAGSVGCAQGLGLLPEQEGAVRAPHRLCACYADLAGAQLQLPGERDGTS